MGIIYLAVTLSRLIILPCLSLMLLTAIMIKSISDQTQKNPHTNIRQ